MRAQEAKRQSFVISYPSEPFAWFFAASSRAVRATMHQRKSPMLSIIPDMA